MMEQIHKIQVGHDAIIFLKQKKKRIHDIHPLYKFIQNSDASEDIPDSQDTESAPHSPYDWKVRICNMTIRKKRKYRINLERYDSNTKKTVGFFIGNYTTRDDAER